jgi:hypothetical protein
VKARQRIESQGFHVDSLGGRSGMLVEESSKTWAFFDSGGVLTPKTPLFDLF